MVMKDLSLKDRNEYEFIPEVGDRFTINDPRTPYCRYDKAEVHTIANVKFMGKHEGFYIEVDERSTKRYHEPDSADWFSFLLRTSSSGDGLW